MSLPWLDVAKKLIGTQEYATGNNPAILQWASLIGLDKTYTADSIPWCGLTTAYIMAQSGFEPVKEPLWALNWAKFGEQLSEPAYGCVIVYKRAAGGHVGLYLGEDANYYYTLGGNQSNQVCVKGEARSRAVAFRWPPDSDNLLVKGRVKTTLASAQANL